MEELELTWIVLRGISRWGSQSCSRVITCFMIFWAWWATLRMYGRAETPSPRKRTMSATKEAASIGLEATATPTSAAANAGASLIPSPTWNQEPISECLWRIELLSKSPLFCNSLLKRPPKKALLRFEQCPALFYPLKLEQTLHWFSFKASWLNKSVTWISRLYNLHFVLCMFHPIVSRTTSETGETSRSLVIKRARKKVLPLWHQRAGFAPTFWL